MITFIAKFLQMRYLYDISMRIKIYTAINIIITSGLVMSVKMRSVGMVGRQIILILGAMTRAVIEIYYYLWLD